MKDISKLVSVIIPTKNSGEFLEACLQSIKNQTYRNIEVIVNDDVSTSDNTKEVVEQYGKEGLNVRYVQENRSMAQGRKVGAEHATGEIILHLDSDMVLDGGVVEDVVDQINAGFDALVIPEESFGIGFWAKCKWLEKKCYEEVEQIESLRSLKTSVYKAVGGHNPDLVFSEDKDLDIRVRDGGYKVGRIRSYIRHNEGHPSLLKILKKKMGYAPTANKFAELHPRAFAWQVNVLNRYWIYLIRIKYLLLYPHLYIGMFFMKTLEFFCGGLGLFNVILRNRRT
ncbi:hypothetical protein A2704_03455 [Candidatus Kaiserbacteria bacterium RIFCSPHIGHO2_01_FULL_54_36b]|uniref:Glycosyltransferase 2-like domain-containing protein n=1 Tax=Candidatus Kaiserbacteria bacterium RIFCSPHIGHO2_01_FULL_54_36b TaxID=1798483 RepID=A0A1F6CQE8_9BACT|nr:MAG: hypothetical protein A2704_03455 [Candidatus Kaiserbacteria bacterium RIFCSPHIGHO2_01_FULL_54_36b]